MLRSLVQVQLAPRNWYYKRLVRVAAWEVLRSLVPKPVDDPRNEVGAPIGGKSRFFLDSAFIPRPAQGKRGGSVEFLRIYTRSSLACGVASMARIVGVAIRWLLRDMP